MPGSQQQSCRKRRRVVTRLYLDGLSQADIAAHLGINQATVSRDLREAGRDPSIPDVRALWRADEAALAHVGRLERELWEIWERSREEISVERTIVNPRTGGETIIRSTTNRPGGEPRCFGWIFQCDQLRRTIDHRMDKRQLCGTIGIQKRMMRIEAAVKSLRQRYVGQVFQPARTRPDESLTQEDYEQTADPLRLPLV
jgi:transcriptional regulator with XRE-family HTH domain